jgi:hypothetical protein
VLYRKSIDGCVKAVFDGATKTNAVLSDLVFGQDGNRAPLPSKWLTRWSEFVVASLPALGASVTLGDIREVLEL